MGRQRPGSPDPLDRPASGSDGRTPTALGYPFAPIPSRVVRDVLAGVLSVENFLLLCHLYERSDFHLLGQGEPSLRRTLRQMADALPFDVKRDTFSKWLRRLRDRGYLSWEVERLADGRCVYAFTLSGDSLSERSEACPSAVRADSEAACPTPQAPLARSVATVPEPEPSAVSESPQTPETVTVSESTPDLSESPGCANPHGYAENAGYVETPCPTPSEVQRTNFSCRETQKDVSVEVDDAGVRESHDLHALINHARRAAEKNILQEADALALPPAEQETVLALVTEFPGGTWVNDHEPPSGSVIIDLTTGTVETVTATRPALPSSPEAATCAVDAASEARP